MLDRHRPRGRTAGGLEFNQGDENDERAMVAPGLGAGVGLGNERRLVVGEVRGDEGRISDQFRSDRIAPGFLTINVVEKAKIKMSIAIPSNSVVRIVPRI